MPHAAHGYFWEVFKLGNGNTVQGNGSAGIAGMPFDRLPAEGFDFGRDFDRRKFAAFAKKAKLPADSIEEEALFELGAAEPRGSEFVMANAGVLFFAAEPQRLIRQSCITCVRYRGNGMASIIDRKDLGGDLLSLIDEAESFVKRHTRLAYLFDKFKRVDIEEYPYDAIREAIINALCHRDYTTENVVFVNVFDDRVEVISPGSIPDNLRLKDVYGRSRPRNFLIASLLRAVGYVEKAGSGLKRMEELMLKHGLGKPAYEANRAFFTVTFRGPGERILELVKPSGIVDLRELGLNERQIEALNYLQQNKIISREEYERVFGASKRTAVRDLNMLIEKNMIRSEGAGKATKYALV